MPASEIRLRAIAVEEAYPFRSSILRPTQSIEASKYPFDHAAESYHVGYFQDDRLLGVGSILPDARENTTASYSWRIRGMAVLQEARGMGIGSQILIELIAHAATHPGEIWCNGRVDARSFYERHGFVARGPVFDVSHTGRHLLFIKP